VNAAQRGQRTQSADVSQNAQAGGGGEVDEANQKLADQYARLSEFSLSIVGTSNW
jgi:hypothetical protein